MSDQHPYDLHAHGNGGFISFDSRSGDVISLPLLSLDRATLRNRGSRCELVLEFDSNLVTIHGTGLASVAEHLFAGRVKAIRMGTYDGCVVDGIQIVDG